MKLQRTNRVYASIKENQGCIYKVKVGQTKRVKVLTKTGKLSRAWQHGLTEEQINEAINSMDENGYGTYTYDSKSKLANCPESCVIDNEQRISISEIDKSYYIDMAKKRIVDYLGSDEEPKKTKPREKKEKTTMAKELNYELSNDNVLTSKLFTKISKLRAYFDRVAGDFEKDGYNSNQKYEYVKAMQYKKALRKGCLECGLEFKCSILDYSPVDMKKDSSMTLIAFKGIILIVDIETGFSTAYNTVTMSADVVDKQASKGETLMIKDFIKANFLVDDNDENDPEADVVTKPTTVAPKKPLTVTAREEVKQTIVSTTNDQPAGNDTITYVVGLIDKIRNASGNPSEASKTLAVITEKDTNGKYVIDPLKLRGIINQIEDRANALGISI